MPFIYCFLMKEKTYDSNFGRNTLPKLTSAIGHSLQCVSFCFTIFRFKNTKVFQTINILIKVEKHLDQVKHLSLYQVKGYSST